MPDQLSPEQEAIIRELSTRSDLNPDQQAIINELMTRIQPQQTPGQPEITPQPQAEQQPGALQGLWEGYKGGASMAAEAAAVPVSGIAGLAKYISESLKTGSIDKGLEAANLTIEQIQQAAANLIPAQPAKEEVGKVVQAGMNIPGVRPVVETAMKAPQALGDISYQGALSMGLSPETAASVGAIGKSIIPATFEILAAETTPVIKKGLLRRVLNKADKSGLYDEFGNLKNEVRIALKDADIGLDEVTDILPERSITQKSAAPIAEQMKAAKKPQGNVKFGRMQQLAKTFDPDIEKIKAFEDLNVDYLPQYVSKNPTARAIAENLKDVPGSLMAPREKQIVEQVAEAADNIIKQGGGTIEKGELATKYIENSKKVIDDIAAQEKPLYETIDQFIPGETSITTDNITSTLQDIAKSVGGEDNLLPEEKKLLNLLNQDANPVYGLLDRERQTIGKQLAGKDTVFRDVGRRKLSRLYDAMTQDQEAAVLANGNKELLNTYKSAKLLTVQRKNIEKMMKDTIGRKMAGDITKKMGPAVKGLAAGDTMTFENLLSNIPSELGPEMRQDVVTSALNDAFIAGSRGGEGKLSIGGFGSYWKRLNRQPKAMKLLKKELSPDTWKRLNSLATVNDALKETMALSQKTGKILSTAGLFEEVNKIGARAYGLVGKGVSRIPGGRTMMGLADIGNIPKNARTMAADELLTDRRFQNMLKQQALGKIDTAKKVANVDRLIENIKTYQKWKKTLPEADLDQLAAVGPMGYFTGKQQEQPAP